MTELRPVNQETALKTPTLPDAQTVTSVQHWTDRLFSFRVTRPASLRFRSGDMTAILVSVGNCFVFASGWTDAPASQDAVSALKAGARTEALFRQFEATYVFGRWNGGQGNAVLSTNPLLEGKTVLTQQDRDVVTFHGADFHGAPQIRTFEALGPCPLSATEAAFPA